MHAYTTVNPGRRLYSHKNTVIKLVVREEPYLCGHTKSVREYKLYGVHNKHFTTLYGARMFAALAKGKRI